MIRKHLQNKVKERPRNLCHKIRKPIQKRKLDQPEQNFCAAILQMFCMGGTTRSLSTAKQSTARNG